MLQRREEHCQSNLSVGGISRAESSGNPDESAAFRAGQGVGPISIHEAGQNRAYSLACERSAWVCWERMGHLVPRIVPQTLSPIGCGGRLPQSPLQTAEIWQPTIDGAAGTPALKWTSVTRQKHPNKVIRTSNVGVRR